MKLNWIIPLFAAAGLALAGCGGGGSSPKAATEMPQPSPYEVAQAAIAAADTAAAAQAAVDAAVAAGITGAQLQSLNMAVAERTAALAAAAAAEQRQMLVDAAACTDATAACVAAHDALIAALQADVAALQADGNATNAQVQAAQMALAEAQSTRNAINMALVEIDRSTETGSAVGAAVDAANALEDARDPADIEAAEMLLATAEGMLTESDDYAAQIAAAKMSIARAKERNSVDAAVMAAEAAATGLATESGVDAVTAAQALVNAANMAIDDSEHLTDAEKAAQTAKVTAAQGTVTVAKNANDEAARLAAAEEKRKADEAAAAQAKADKAMAAKLYAGLADGGDLNDDTNPATISITATGLSADADGAGAGTAVTIKATTTSVPSYGAWNGTDYVRTVASPSLTDHAVVYSNRDAPKMELFATKYATQLAEDSDNGRLNNAYLTNTNTDKSFIAASDFVSGSGFKDHTEQDNDVVKLRGSFNGGMGYYHCEQTGGTACRSAVDGSGGITLTGGWSFEPDDGTMASTPDADYVVFGWWSREVAASVDVATFAQPVGANVLAAANAGLVGTATYTGGAAGKYSINEPVEGDPNSGAFSAKAELTAKFGDSTALGTISGMLTDFMAGGEAKDWSVALVGAGTAAGADITADRFGTPATPAADGTDTARTVWTIDGTAGARSGSWSGNFYYESATQQTAANTPPTAAGEFSASYGNVGRMVGAFGAEKD